MAEQEVKLKISTDATGAITGINSFSANLKKLSSDSESFSAKVKKNWLETSAAVYGSWQLINKAAQYMDQGAAAMRIESSFKIIAEESGVSSEQMIANLKKLTKETIDDSDLMQKANKMMLSEYDPKQVQQFASVVGTSAKYMGTTTGEAFERMSDSLANRMPRALVQAGAVTRDQMKIVEGAIKAGADQTVLFELAIANLQVKQLQLQGTEDDATIAMQRFHTQVKQTGEDVGVFLVRACQVAYSIFQRIGATSLWLTANFWKLCQGIAAFRSMITFGDISQKFKEDAERFKAYSEADYKAYVDLQKKALDNFNGTADVQKKATKEQIDNAKKVRDALLDKLKAYVETSKNADKVLKVLMDANKKAYEAEVNDAQHAARMRELAGDHQLAARLEQINAEQLALNKLYTLNTTMIGMSKVGSSLKDAQYEKAWEEYSKEWNKNENKRAETTAEVSNYIRDTNINLFKQIDQYSKEYQKAEEDATRQKYDTIRSVVTAAERLGIIDAQEASAERIMIAKAEANEIATIAANIALSKARAMQEVTGATKGPYSSEYSKATEDAIRSQADLLKIQLGDRFNKEEWITAKIQEETAKRLDSQADYYSQIGGFEKKSLAIRLRAIEERRKAEGKLTGDQKAANQLALQETNAAIADEQARKLALIQNTMSGYAQLFEGLSQMYDKDSSERKRLHDVAMGFLLAEKIAAFALAVVKAVEACANAAASGDPYTAVARIAAVAAALGAVFASAGMSMHLGGGGADVQPVKSESTVLGAERGTESQSVDRTLKILDDTYNLQYHELRGIHDAVKGLNDNITGLVRALVLGGGSFDSGIFATILTNSRPSWTSSAGSLGSFGIGAFSGDPFTAMTHTMLEGLFGGQLGKNIGSFLSSVFGGRTSSWTSDAGIAYRAPTVGGLQQGSDVSANWYVIQQYLKEGGWFHGNRSWSETTYGAVPEDVTVLLTKVYKNISDTLILLTNELGTDIEKTLNYAFGYVELSLKDQSGEQIEKTLKAYFSRVGDLAVKTLFGDMLQAYQQVGEGMMETAIRLITDKATVMEALKMTGQAFTGTTQEVIAFSETIIEMAGGLDKFTDAVSYYYDNFYSNAERFAYAREGMVSTFEEMDLAMPRNKEQFRDLVESLDLTTVAGKETYVALIQMAEATDKYYDQVEEWVGKVKDARESMRMEGMEYEQQRSTAGQLALNAALEQAKLGNYAMIDDLDFGEIASQASSTALFATRKEYEANYYQTYNRMSELERLIGGQVPIDEQQLIIQKEQLKVLNQIAGNTEFQLVDENGIHHAPKPGQLGYDPGMSYLLGYASGGDFAGGWRLVGENGPELEYTGASRIYSNKDSKALLDYSELLAEIKALRVDLRAGDYAIAKSAAKTAKLLDRWNGEGLPAERTLT